MTARLPWKRGPGAAERKANRKAFQKLKAECAAAPTPQTLARRAAARTDHRRRLAVAKLKRAMTGRGAPPFSVLQLAELRQQELRQLRAYSAARYSRLTPEQRDRLRDNVYLLIATAPDGLYLAVANFGGS